MNQDHSGRTTRMIAEAKRLCEAGKAVYVVASSKAHVKVLEAAFELHRSIKVETIESIGYFNWRQMRVHGAHANCEFLFDHYALETYFAPMIAELHRFDTDAAVQAECTGNHSEDCTWCGFGLGKKAAGAPTPAEYFQQRRDLGDARIEAANWKLRYEVATRERLQLRKDVDTLRTRVSELELDSKFGVSVLTLRASEGTSYVVELINHRLRPAGAQMIDMTGRTHPFAHTNQKYAQHEAKEWAAFLGVPDQASCNCIMCDVPTHKEKK